MAQKIVLSAAAIRYLLALKSLEREGGGTRSVDIASALGLSKPSVHNMMKTFDEMGIVSKNAYGAAYLTRIGNEIAGRYGRYYNAVTDLLHNSFPDADNIDAAVFFLLAELPEKSLEGLCGKNCTDIA